MDDKLVEAILKACEPNSNKLNAVDFETGPRTFDILDVCEKSNKIQVQLSDGVKPWHPCKGMIRIMLKVWGPNWHGQGVTLFREPSVMFQGVRVGGIEISHMTGLDKPTDFDVVVTRGKNKIVTIHPLAYRLSEQDKLKVEQIKSEIAGVTSSAMLDGMIPKIKKQNERVQDALRPVFKKKKKELSDG